ncbi:MAG: ABC transporter substrate-binding protein [Halanaerobiales bacterium]
MLNFKSTKNLSLLLVFFIVICISSTAAAQFPVTVRDDLGTEVTLEKEPERIISLAPNVTEMLFSIGLADKIVAVTDYADYPEAAMDKDTVGTITDPSIEKIVSLEPDLVIAAKINKEEIISELRSLGIKVAGFDPTGIDETLYTMKQVGRLTGNSREAQKVVTDLHLKLSEISQAVNSVLENKERPEVFYEIWNDPLSTAGAGTFIDDMIEKAGGTNIGREASGAWPQYSLEMLLIQDPEVYISSPHSASHEVTPEKIKNRKNYDKLRAVKNDRIYIVNQDIVSRPSPRIIDGLKEFVKAIFPELAEEI